MAKLLTLKNDGSGDFLQVETKAASAGAADAGGVPELGADGTLDPSILGAATTGADTVTMTGPDGKLDLSIMPDGIGPDTRTIVASEALSAGMGVNIQYSTGAWRVRRADASNGRKCHGFVKDAYIIDDPVEVYYEGPNTQVTGLAGVDVFLAAVPGGFTTTAPTTAGHLLQRVGSADSATSFYFKLESPAVTLA